MKPVQLHWNITRTGHHGGIPDIVLKRLLGDTWEDWRVIACTHLYKSRRPSIVLKLQHEVTGVQQRLRFPRPDVEQWLDANHSDWRPTAPRKLVLIT